MKLRKLFLASLLISSVFLADVSGRKPDRWHRGQRREIQNNTVELDLSYDFSVPGETFRISFTVILPQTIPGKQKILSIRYSPKPSRFFHENGNRYAEYVFVKPEKRMKVEINIRAELLRYDLLTARENANKTFPKAPGSRTF